MAKTPFELKGRSVFVAGHRGMVGSALMRRLAQEDVELLTVGRREVDLRDQAAVFKWFADKRPQAVFLAAAKVGVPEYKNLVNEKLKTAENLYSFLIEEFHQSRGFVLEVMVVIILIIELAYLFKGKG